MNVGQLRKALQITGNMHRELGDEETAKAIECFSNLLKGKKTEDLSDFAQRIKRAKSRLPQSRSGS
jgi:hypothetical protein